MIVTGIEAVTKKKYKVELDGQLAFVLYKGELARYCLDLDKELKKEQYDEIMNKVLKRAKQYLLHLLTKMDRTECELETKLRRAYYPDEIIEQAIAYVKSYGYVDDESYARRYLQNYEGRLSFRQIKWKLSSKGIPKNILEELTEMRTNHDERELVEAYIQKKIKGKSQLDEKELKKVADFLYRKGIENTDIWDALKKYRK